jgi:corrinoid protein of di/trimethylamine methyltransferase
MNSFLKDCEDAVLNGHREQAVALAKRAVSDGIDLLDAVENGFSAGIRRAGDLWEKGEYFLPELAFSAEVMKAAMDIVKPALLKSRSADSVARTVVIGTVQGDIHDIGKSLVSTLLSANGYNVVDLGADVPHVRFVEEVQHHGAELVCMSALLTTTMTGQGRVISMLEKQGLRGRTKIMVGGAPANSSWARQIGADAYAADAVEAVRTARELLA